MLSLRTFLSILILSGYVVSQTDKIEYDGPERSNYFRQTFNDSISNLESLSCGNYMTDSTSPTNPVKYYTFHITSNTKPVYKSLIITTCCYNITSSYCNNSSLDTIVYILQQRKGQIRLLSTIQSYNIDDIQCSTNPNKQSVEMIDYYQGEYIIGIGGYGNQYGSYNISIECSLLSESSPNHIIGIIIFTIIAIILYLFAIKYILSAFGQLFCKKDDAVSLIINNDKSSNVKYSNLDISSVLDECISALKDEDGLDIYQALAVQSSGISFKKWCDSQSVNLQWKGHMNEIKTVYGGCRWLLTRAIIAFLVQIIGLGWITIRLLENQLMYDGNHRAFCDGFPNRRNIVMSVLLGFAITAYVSVQYAKVHNVGVYKLLRLDTESMNKIKSDISLNWLYFGKIINGITCLICAVGSYLMVFQSTSSLDMLMNCVAFFFVLGMDDEFVGPRDYCICIEYLERIKQKNKLLKVDDSQTCTSCCTLFVNPFIYATGFVVPFIPFICL